MPIIPAPTSATTSGSAADERLNTDLVSARFVPEKGAN
jgi:hypothetical protein